MDFFITLLDRLHFFEWGKNNIGLNLQTMWNGKHLCSIQMYSMWITKTDT